MVSFTYLPDHASYQVPLRFSSFNGCKGNSLSTIDVRTTLLMKVANTLQSTQLP